MDRFLVVRPGPSKRRTDDDHDEDSDTSPEPPPKKKALAKYKQNLTYDHYGRRNIPGWMFHMILIQTKLVV